MVAVGTGVSVKRMVAVGLMVGVVVMVAVVFPASPLALPFRRMTRKTKTAPTSRKSVRSPRAIGRLRVISGMRAACTSVDSFLLTAGLNSVPQTRQREAFSARRVPQVGQTFVVGEGFSGITKQNYTMQV